MKLHIYLIFGFVCLTGCASTHSENVKAVNEKFTKIDYEDAISLEEAQIIAKREVVMKNVAAIYDMTNPVLADDMEEFKNSENYWFIYFREKKPAGIPFIYMVLINKETGKVKFSDDFNEGNQWIMEAALLR